MVRHAKAKLLRGVLRRSSLRPAVVHEAPPVIFFSMALSFSVSKPKDRSSRA